MIDLRGIFLELEGACSNFPFVLLSITRLSDLTDILLELGCGMFSLVYILVGPRFTAVLYTVRETRAYLDIDTHFCNIERCP